MKERFEQLTIETADDENGQFIILTQDDCGNVDRVAIHLIHLRYLAEKFGFVEISDPQAKKTIATLKRRIGVLYDRIEFLQDFLANHSDHKHADLSFEVTYATATLDIANEFCADLDLIAHGAELHESNLQAERGQASSDRQSSHGEPVQLSIHA